jgi:hypothetical protein
VVRTCIDDSDGRICDGIPCLARGGIGQTKIGDVACVDSLYAAARVFGVCGGERE